MLRASCSFGKGEPAETYGLFLALRKESVVCSCCLYVQQLLKCCSVRQNLRGTHRTFFKAPAAEVTLILACGRAWI